MPTKLNITPGPWVAEYESYVPPFKCSVLDGDPNNGATYIVHGFKMADISAIVNAVNNTYHAGINPEAVPEMLEALNKIANFHPDGNPERIISLASEILQKATL